MPKNSIKQYLFYALPAMPLALLGLPLYVYLPTFYAKDINLGFFEVGAILLIARIFDMFTDPIIGYLSDRFSSRKLFMFIGMMFLLVGFYALTHPVPNAGYMWLLGFSIVAYTGWTLVSVPFYAVGADLGENYAQNTRYATYRELFNITGVLLALILPYSFGVAQNPKDSLMLMNNVIFILLPPLLLVFFVKIKPNLVQNSVQSIKTFYIYFIDELKNSRYLFGAFFLNSFANAVPATLFLLYVEHVIGSFNSTGMLLIIYFLSGILALPFWNYLSSKTSKKTAWMCSILNAIVFFSIVPFLSHGDFNYFLVITILTGMSLGADMVLPASMQADIAQNSTSAPRELGGTLFGFFAMLTKLSLAFGVGVSFAILGLFDFSPIEPSELSLVVLSLLYAGLPIVLKLAALSLIYNHKEKMN